MTCTHCQKRVEEALNKLSGLSAEVDLTQGIATIEVSGGNGMKQACERQSAKRAIKSSPLVGDCCEIRSS